MCKIDLGVTTSVFALILSAGYTFFVKRKLDNQMSKIQDYQIKQLERDAKERQQARLRVEIFRNSNHGLVIKNIGKSEARNVTLQSEEIEYCLYKMEDLLPTNLLPEQYITIPARFEKGGVNRQITLCWDDDYGTNRSELQTISIPY